MTVLIRLEDKVMALLQQRPLSAQAAFAVLANRVFGLDVEPQGIAGEIGGVVVNGKPIVIGASCVFEASDRRRPRRTAEEAALVTAMRQVEALVREGGLAALDEFGVPVSGEPLTVLFNLPTDTAVPLNDVGWV